MEAPLITPRMMKTMESKLNKPRFNNASKKKVQKEESLETAALVSKTLFIEKSPPMMKFEPSRMIR